MNDFTFALPNGFDWNVKTFSKQVRTKKWAKLNSSKLIKYADKLTSANCDKVQTIGCMLQAAFGANIGRQVESMLTENDYIKIRTNIIQAVYK